MFNSNIWIFTLNPRLGLCATHVLTDLLILLDISKSVSNSLIYVIVECLLMAGNMLSAVSTGEDNIILSVGEFTEGKEILNKYLNNYIIINLLLKTC